MRLSLLVCTFGSEAWAARGMAALGATRSAGFCEAVVVHENTGTLASVRNAAADTAEGEWLCFLDGDDQLAPGYAQAMADALAAKPASATPPLLVPAISYVHPPNSRNDERATPPAIPNWGQNMLDVNCACIGTVVSRELFLTVGGFREWPSLEDWDLWLRCIDAGAQLVPVPAAVYRATVSYAGRNADQSPYQAIRRESLARRAG